MNQESLIVSADRKPVWLHNAYEGQPAFLVGGGVPHPDDSIDKLNSMGALRMTLNHHAPHLHATFRLMMDPPVQISDGSVLRDPSTIKLFALRYVGRQFGDAHPGFFTRDLPGAIFFRSQMRGGNPERFFESEYCDCGEYPEIVERDGNVVSTKGGTRSCMFPAIRLLHWMGVRTIYLVNCDFSGQVGVDGYFAKLNQMFMYLRPVFDDMNLTVLNTMPHSECTAFEHVSFADATRNALEICHA